jgi:hypothetical protein
VCVSVCENVWTWPAPASASRGDCGLRVGGLGEYRMPLVANIGECRMALVANLGEFRVLLVGQCRELLDTVGAVPY